MTNESNKYPVFTRKKMIEITKQLPEDARIELARLIGKSVNNRVAKKCMEGWNK